MNIPQSKERFLADASSCLSGIYDKLSTLASLKLEELDPKATMLIVIDINNGFAKAGALYSPRTQALIEPIANLVDRCISLGCGLLAYSDKHTEQSPELGAYPPHCMQGSEEWHLVDELSRLSQFVVYKNSTNGFLAGGGLPRPEIKNYIITGCCTDICIYQFATTLRAALNEQNNHSRVIVPIDFVDTYDAPWHNADFANLIHLDSMMSNGVEVVAHIN